MPFVYDSDAADPNTFLEIENGQRNMPSSPVNKTSAKKPQGSSTQQRARDNASNTSGVPSMKQKNFEKNAESGYYYPMDELLYLKYSEKLMIYKKIPAPSND